VDGLAALDGRKPAAIAFWNIVRTPAAERDMHAVARAVEEVNGALTLLDRHLAQHEFVAGEQLSIGDIPVGAIAHRWLALPGIERPELPALQRWYRSLTQRSAFRAHVMLPLR
jgi:glutathione S-transferase